MPPSNSSHDSHVPHGVGPPAQFIDVPARMRRAPVIVPSAANVIDDAPPPAALGTSELATRIQPPSVPAVGYVAWPSVKTCHGYAVPGTGSVAWAILRDVKPCGSMIPLA